MPRSSDFRAVLLAGAVRLATPITLAALGETLVERCGIVNLGVEGMMALGAFVGVWGASGQGWAAGLLLGAVAGGSLGLLMGLAVLKGGVNQIVAGIAITLLGIGLAFDYLFQIWQPSGRSAVVVPLVPILRLPLLDRLPLIGEALFAQSPLSYFAVAAVVAASIAMRRTTVGLNSAPSATTRKPPSCAASMSLPCGSRHWCWAARSPASAARRSLSAISVDSATT